MGKTSLALLAAATLLLGACDPWDQPSRLRLPPSAERAGSQSVSFRVYRYPIHGLTPAGVAKVDAFGRGLDDLAVVNTGSSDLTLFRNLGDGTFREYARLE